MNRDLVLLHQVRDALVELFGDPARTLHHRLDIRADLFGHKAIGTGVLHIVINFRRAQQRLGRDAAPVEADAAQILTLDNRGLEPKLRGTDRGNIATGAGAEDDDVVIFSQQTVPFCFQP